jgi:glycosyltransferase involved in cell wall biosynthesis
VAFAGGGVTVKGAQVLLDALPLLLPHVPGLRVAVAGGGDARLLNAFRRFEPQVWVLGRVPFPEMRAFFGAADLSLVPSVWHENSPVVIFENFQMGTPVVGSDFGGIPEFIEPGATGYLFPRGDSAALAERVIRHFARPARARRRMRQACYRFVQTALTWERHVAGTLAVYDEVVAA